MPHGYEWINHSMAPTRLPTHDFRVTIGADRAKPYSASIFNISAMSFGALSANAILALNGGAARGRFAHDTGEGSISQHHRVHGGDLIWEIGSGYFGCRHHDGRFNPEAFAAAARDPQVKMIELKLSQGAKPGHGGVLPGAEGDDRDRRRRATCRRARTASARRSHSAFDTPVQMLEFIDRLRDLSGGKPTGFKLCIGHPWEWFAICKAMLHTGIVPDFIVVDGAEGGTGAAPLEFTDHVGAPLQEGLLLVHNTLLGLNLRSKIKIGCAGKVIGAFDIARAMALGADWCNAARGFMFALGCLQAQACHTGACPTGVATQDKRRQQALVVPDKMERVYRFHQNTLEALKELVQAAGLDASEPDQRLPHRAPRRRPRGAAAGQPAALRPAGRAAGRVERVYRYHQNTLEALKELVQAAGLNHPNQINAFHIVRALPTTKCACWPTCCPSCSPERCWPRRAARANGRTTSTATTGRWPARTALRRCSRWHCRRRWTRNRPGGC